VGDDEEGPERARLVRGCHKVVYVTELGPHCCVCDIRGDQVAVGVV
jgi:hypothetical protein